MNQSCFTHSLRLDSTKHWELFFRHFLFFCFFLFCGCQMIDGRHNVEVLILTHAQFLFSEITIKQETN